MGYRCPIGTGNFDEGKSMPQHARWHSDVNCAKTDELIKMPFGLWTWVGPRKHLLHRAQIPRAKGQLLVERTCPGNAGMPYDILLWAVQKWLNQSICCLGCGLGWAKGSTISIVFTRLRQRALTGGDIHETWQIQLNCPFSLGQWCGHMLVS